MAYTDAQKKAIYAYRKRNKEKVNYINRKSDAWTFIRDYGNKEDLIELQKLLENVLKGISAESVHPDKITLEEAIEKDKTRVYRRYDISVHVTTKRMAVYQGLRIGHGALLGIVDYSKEKEEFLQAGGNPVTAGWVDRDGEKLQYADLSIF